MSDVRPVAVAFDLDNTLIDRNAAVRAWWRTHHPHIDLARVEAEDGGGHRSRADWFAALGLPGEHTHFLATIADFVAPAPGVAALLDRLARRYRLALLTNGGSRTQRTKLARAGLSQRFEAVLVSGELGVDKPHPRAFGALLDALHLPPEAVLFVGDDRMRDIDGARACGLHAVQVRSPHHLPEALAPWL